MEKNLGDSKNSLRRPKDERIGHGAQSQPYTQVPLPKNIKEVEMTQHQFDFAYHLLFLCCFLFGHFKRVAPLVVDTELVEYSIDFRETCC